MKIDETLISYLEDLSMLTLSTDEKNCMIADLEKSLNEIAKLSDLNTGDAEQCSLPFDDINIFRSDEVQPSFDRELILKNAAVKNDEFFIAPKTVE